MEREISISAERFLNLIRSSKKGKLKIYLGMAAGVGKTFRMLLEAKELHANKADVVIGYIETHNRKETENLLSGIPILARKQIYYKGKMLEEMDIDSILLQKPEIVLVDELAHTNMPGSKNKKRWEDILELIDAGINVITTVNIQHLESVTEKVEKITGLNISEQVPDKLVLDADEVVNVDLTIDELIKRLKEGKIYDLKKVHLAINNFFQKEKLLQLRDLTIKEVSRQVERKIVREISLESRNKINTIVTALSSNYKSGKNIIRKSSRIADVYKSKWYVIYIQTKRESMDKIDTTLQRMLINNFKLATELGAEIIEINKDGIAKAIVDFAKIKEAELIIIGKPTFSLFYTLNPKNLFKELTSLTAKENIDILMVASNENNKK